MLRWPKSYCVALQIERSRFEPWTRTLCCVLRQDTLLLKCLSPLRSINNAGNFNASESCSSDPEGRGEGAGKGYVSCYSNWKELLPDEPLSSYADLTFQPLSLRTVESRWASSSLKQGLSQAAPLRQSHIVMKIVP